MAREDDVTAMLAPDRKALAFALLPIAAADDRPFRVACKHPPTHFHLVPDDAHDEFDIPAGKGDGGGRRGLARDRPGHHACHTQRQKRLHTLGGTTSVSSSKFDPFLPFLFSLRKKNDHRPSRKTKNLKWAVESRAKNQRSAVQLLHLFMEYEEQWKTKNWAGAAQALLSVSFSLWRAAFLADKTAKRSAVFSHARNFLEKVIEDNAISYTQDRNCKDWTFNYYTTNAKQALLTLHEHWHTELPAWEKRKRTPTERWQYCQELLDQAVANFAVLAQGTRAKKTLGKQRKDVRLAAKVRKQKSRAYTLASRIAAEEVAGDTLPTGDPS